MKEKKRRVEICVISDVHLGTNGCHAKELINYLRSIKPGILVLNGDIIDIWQFNKRYWPKAHMKVIKYLIGIATKGTQVYYITGNHDETLRKFAGLQMGNLSIVNQIELKIDGKKAWIFHGDVFDVVMQYSKWLARLGSIGYDLLIRLNTFVNFICRLLGQGKVSLSKKIKDNVKTAVKYINNFEETAAGLAMSKHYDYLICGHIHHPEMRRIEDSRGNSILYLNSGDWVENLSALEYDKGKWKIYMYHHDQRMKKDKPEDDEYAASITDLDNKELFSRMLDEFQK